MEASIKKNVSQDVIPIDGSIRTLKVKQVLQDFLNGKKLRKSINSDRAFAYNDVHASISSGKRNKVQELLCQGKMVILVADEMYISEGISLKFLTMELLKGHPELRMITIIISVSDPRRESSCLHVLLLILLLIGCSIGHLKVLQLLPGFLNRKVMCNISNFNRVVSYDDVVQATISRAKGNKVQDLLLLDVTSLPLGFETAQPVDDDERTIIRRDKLLRRYEFSNKPTAPGVVSKINVCFDIRTLPVEQVETSNLKPIIVVIYEPEDIIASFMLYNRNESGNVNILSCSKMNTITPTQKMSRLLTYDIEPEICFVVCGPSTNRSSVSSARRNH